MAKKTMFMLDLLNYAYELEFDERPDYERIKFLFRKILLDRNFLPEKKFDWSLRPGESFMRVNNDDRHSSISSCDIKSDEDPIDHGADEELRANINKQRFDYVGAKRYGYELLQ